MSHSLVDLQEMIDMVSGRSTAARYFISQIALTQEHGIAARKTWKLSVNFGTKEDGNGWMGGNVTHDDIHTAFRLMKTHPILTVGFT